MGEIVAELKQVKKTIGTKTIIPGLDLTMYAGEVLGLLGPNGAGKSTTIKMIVGLISITSGDVLIQGHSIQNEFEKAVQHVGAIVENPEMYKFLTGYQNLIHYARMVKPKVTKKRIEEVVELVGMTHTIHQKVKTYSLGMKQRLGLAQALLHSPKLLILDEPTNGLDPAGIKDLRSYLQKIAHEENVAVLVSSHMLSEMEMMCDKIAIIQNGVLLSVDKVGSFIGEESYKQVHFKIKETDTAEKALQTIFANVPYQLTPEGITIEVEQETVPEIIKLFVQWEVPVYEVTITAKTLEDKFLEVTGGNQIV